jgi:type IV secretory pathway VirB10-like protein
MRMNAKLLDSINSDIPASTIRLALTTPLFDKFDYDTVILDKGTIIVAQQVGKAEFGQVRIPLKIEQIEPPSGEVIKVDGGVGDQQGAAGVPGAVDAHVGQLLLATGINAVLNLGLGYAVGTPGRGEHYEDPAQRAVTDASRSVAQDANSYSRQVLRRPPTITVDAENEKRKFVTISLLENIQLHRPPAVAR